jgi:arylsulfatase A-like enzyme
MSARSELPDVVIVVLDCGRNIDFPGGPEGVRRMPFLESLRAESVLFPKAVSPSAWTVPGHASLFTGLYPWEHRVHMKSALRLDPMLPTIASVLRAHGYATLSLSANGFLGPDFGLLSGFEDAAWGVWWEKFLRLPDRSQPIESTWEPKGENNGGPLSDVDGATRGALGLGARLAHPFVKGKDPVWMGPLVNGINLGIQRVRASDHRGAFPISPWIEPTLTRWLQERKHEEPVFCFVNFLETHEPYVADSREMSNPLTWARYALQRTDKPSFLAGRWRPSPREFQNLRTLYRSAMVSLDSRIHAVVEAFRAAGRWRNTLFILTGDHGQAFGEHGYLFHAARVWEPVVRVPLWVRWPNGRGGGQVGRGWTSLIDVAPTVFDAAGVTQKLSSSARRLDTLIAEQRPEPVYAMADGLQGRAQIARIAPDCVALWDTPWVAGFAEEGKLLLDVAHEQWSAYDVANDPREERDLFPQSPTRWSALADNVRTVGSRLANATPAAITPGVDQLLKSWGYD